ncbi:MAG TPA: DUF72 domain-containing protein [Frankiaceae bacterium]|nr:DUF72 domain-containing protein [Frankiaceae bacterium]
MTLWVGTSGWRYADWRGRFYPPGLPPGRWLERHAAAFATVEVNAAFYRLPARATFESWVARTPPDEVMAVKASRYLTHVRRLRDPAEPVARLLERARGLGGRLGPVLLQLSPTLRCDPAALDATLACFPPTVRVAVEPRHDSWWAPPVREVLAARGAALCWADRHGDPLSPLWRTTRWGYVRLHEGDGQPWPSYDAATLRCWVDRIRAAYDDGEDVFVYTNNDLGGAALRDAVRLADLARALGRTVSRTPALAAVSGAPR